MSDKTKQKDFVEIKFTGYANSQVFDSNIEEDLKQINPEAKPKKTIVKIGEKMVVLGLDKALEDKELNKEYEIDLKSKEAFGDRDRNLLKTIPLKSFTEQKVNPQPGMMLTLDQSVVKIVAVSGARVITDFNNPLAGKDIKYKFTITRIVTEEKEKVEALLDFYLRFAPEFEIKEDKIIIKGPKPLEGVIPMFSEKFKGILGKELAFELKEPPKEEAKEESKPEEPQATN